MLEKTINIQKLLYVYILENYVHYVLYIYMRHVVIFNEHHFHCINVNKHLYTKQIGHYLILYIKFERRHHQRYFNNIICHLIKFTDNSCGF